MFILVISYIRCSIQNTISNEEFLTSISLLTGTTISPVDAARLILNILDARPKNSSISPIEFCHKIIETGKRHIRTTEMKFTEGLSLYIESKKHLRPDSFKDIKYLSSRLLKNNSYLANRNFSEISISECENWLSKTFYYLYRQYDKIKSK